jgi:hypothetical protein
MYPEPPISSRSVLGVHLPMVSWVRFRNRAPRASETERAGELTPPVCILLTSVLPASAPAVAGQARTQLLLVNHRRPGW